MNRTLARRAAAGLGLGLLVLAGLPAPASQAQSACVWVSARVAAESPTTVKVDSNGSTCPGVLPPSNPSDPCAGPVEHYSHLDPHAQVDLKLLVCARLP